MSTILEEFEYITGMIFSIPFMDKNTQEKWVEEERATMHDILGLDIVPNESEKVQMYLACK